MTAGRGFIALVAVMFGRARPLPTLAACLLFGFAYALTLRLQGGSVPPQFVAMLPYLATIAVLIAVAVRARRRRAALLPVTERALDDASVVAP
jgi:simple sugar transport system permease protein